MIEYDVNILILEIFDELKKEDIFIQYKILEKSLLSNSEFNKLTNEFNRINDSLTNIDYEPFIKESNKKLLDIQNQIQTIEEYNKYMEYYELCNKRLEGIAKIIFEDIVDVGKGQCGCACK